jgi:hypothetical protein
MQGFKKLGHYLDSYETFLIQTCSFLGYVKVFGNDCMEVLFHDIVM